MWSQRSMLRRDTDRVAAERLRQAEGEVIDRRNATPGTLNDTLRPFFERYAELLQGSEPEALSDLYAPTFIAAGPEGSATCANDSHLHDWLAQTDAGAEYRGLVRREAVAIHDMDLSPIHTLATVTWGAADADTSGRIESQTSYLLERTGNGWKILSHISRQEPDHGSNGARRDLIARHVP